MEEESFYQLLLISGLAVLVPVVATRVPARVLPALVGEIIAGIIIGTSGLNLIDPTPVLDFLAEFGFAYLMFLSGLELDPHLLTAASGAPYRGLKTRLSSPLGSGLVILGGTLAIAFFGVAILELSGLAPDLWLTTLILSTTSVGVVVPTLKERGLAARPYGQVPRSPYRLPSGVSPGGHPRSPSHRVQNRGRARPRHGPGPGARCAGAHAGLRCLR